MRASGAGDKHTLNTHVGHLSPSSQTTLIKIMPISGLDYPKNEPSSIYDKSFNPLISSMGESQFPVSNNEKMCTLLIKYFTTEKPYSDNKIPVN